MEKKIYWVTGSKIEKAATRLRKVLFWLTIIRYHKVVEYFVGLRDDKIYTIGTSDYARSLDTELWHDAMRRSELFGPLAVFVTEMQARSLGLWASIINRI